MRRRSLLSAVAALTTAGCFDRSSSGPPQDAAASSDTDGGEYGGLEITSVYPREVDREYIDYEYVELENTAANAVPLGGVTVEYDDTTSYEFSNLDLEADATVVLASRARTETTLTTAPPVYIRSAEFGQTTDTSVLDGDGTVRLQAPDGTVVDSKRYDARGGT